MIDHVSITVGDLERAGLFYASTLQPLGFEQLVTRERTIGFGKRYPEFWLNLRDNAAPVAQNSGFHVALRAPNTSAVDAFYKSALENGGSCDGPPGIRDAYSPRYYAAFIRDPDGNRIEAVTFVEDKK